MKYLKKTFCIILVCVLLFSMPVYATQNTGVQPRYAHVSTIHLVLDINTTSGRASCTAETVTLGYLPVDMECHLQRLVYGNWETVKTWEASGIGKATMEKAYYVYSGYLYRLSVDITVYNSNGAVIDNVTETSSTYYYP